MTDSGKQISFVIFDCDGVLIDSENLSMRVWMQLLEARQIHIDQQYFFEHFLGRRFEHVKAVIKQDFKLIVDDSLAQQFACELKQIFEKELKPTDGINEVLTSLNVPYCLATSSSRERTRIALNATGLERYFSEAQIFTAADVARGKPAPDLFLHAANQHGVLPAHCLVIEDSAPGLQAAKAAEMQWLHFVGGSHMLQNAGKRENALANWRDLSGRYPYLID